MRFVKAGLLFGTLGHALFDVLVVSALLFFGFSVMGTSRERDRGDKD